MPAKKKTVLSKEPQIVYKVVSSTKDPKTFRSCTITKGFYSLTYRLGKFTRSRDPRRGIAVFRSLTAAKNFAGVGPILACVGFDPLPAHEFLSIAHESFPLSTLFLHPTVKRTMFTIWPPGTKFFRKVLVLKEVG